VRIERIVLGQASPADQARARGFYDFMVGQPHQAAPSRSARPATRRLLSAGLAKGEQRRIALNGRPWYETEKARCGIHRAGKPIWRPEPISMRKSRKSLHSACTGGPHAHTPITGTRAGARRHAAPGRPAPGRRGRRAQRNRRRLRAQASPTPARHAGAAGQQQLVCQHHVGRDLSLQRQHLRRARRSLRSFRPAV